MLRCLLRVREACKAGQQVNTEAEAEAEAEAESNRWNERALRSQRRESRRAANTHDLLQKDLHWQDGQSDWKQKLKVGAKRNSIAKLQC